MAHYPPSCPPSCPSACPPGRGSTIFQTSENFCSALEAFPSIPSAFQKEIHQKRHFIELSSDPAGFWQRLKFLSCWKNRGGTSLKEVKFLCFFSFSRLHSSFSSFSFRCRRLLCLIPGMDRQAVVSGSLSRCKVLIHPFSPLFLFPCFDRLWICHWRVKVFCRPQSQFTFTQGQTLLPGMANKGAAKKEVENKWTRSQTKFKMALFVVPPQK